MKPTEVGSMHKTGHEDSIFSASLPDWTRNVNLPVNVLNIVLMLTFFFAFEGIYRDSIRVIWHLFPYSYNNERLPIGLITVIAFAALIPTRLRKPSDLYVALAIVITLTPTATMYVNANLAPETFVLTILGIAVIMISRYAYVPVVESWRLDPRTILNVLVFIAFLGSIVTTMQIGSDGFDISFDGIYSRRAVEMENIEGVSAFVQSIARNTSFFIIILATMLPGYFKYVFIGLIFAVIDFGFGGHKSVIYGAVVFMLLRLILELQNSITILVFLIVVIYTVIYITLDTQNTFIIETIPDRITAVPVFLNDTYINYYYDKDGLYWGYSKLGLGLVDYLDEFTPPRRIGYVLTGESHMHANTGFIGSGYANAGVGGVIFYAVLIGICCKIIDTYAHRNNAIALVTAICLPGFLLALTSGDTPSVLFSNGWGLSIFLAACLQPTSEKNAVSR